MLDDVKYQAVRNADKAVNWIVENLEFVGGHGCQSCYKYKTVGASIQQMGHFHMQYGFAPPYVQRYDLLPTPSIPFSILCTPLYFIAFAIKNLAPNQYI